MDKLLTPYWISFPNIDFSIKTFGVTAYSIDDAYSLLKEFGYDYRTITNLVEVKENITWDELEKNHVTPNMGPIVIRGIWYPHLNTR